MTEKQYIKITNFFRKTKKRELYTKYLCKYSPSSIISIYFLTIIFLLIKNDSKLYPFVIIPAIDFLFVTFIRKVLNKPRPYDTFDFKPLVPFKKGKGKSFPSRHTASAFIIAIACLYIDTYLGIITFIISILIGLSRIICGVHYPKDILFGLFISLLIGWIGFYYFTPHIISLIDNFILIF